MTPFVNLLGNTDRPWTDRCSILKCAHTWCVTNRPKTRLLLVVLLHCAPFTEVQGAAAKQGTRLLCTWHPIRRRSVWWASPPILWLEKQRRGGGGEGVCTFKCGCMQDKQKDQVFDPPGPLNGLGWRSSWAMMTTFGARRGRGQAARRLETTGSRGAACGARRPRRTERGDDGTLRDKVRACSWLLDTTLEITKAPEAKKRGQPENQKPTRTDD
jgi:hypothetical protein